MKSLTDISSRRVAFSNIFKIWVCCSALPSLYVFSNFTSNGILPFAVAGVNGIFNLNLFSLASVFEENCAHWQSTAYPIRDTPASSAALPDDHFHAQGIHSRILCSRVLIMVCSQCPEN